jgi:hypothetical protein
MKCQKRSCENICQKGPLLSGGTPWQPAGACRRWHRRHVRLLRRGGMLQGVGPAATGGGGMLMWPGASTPGHMPVMRTAAGACRRWPRRHVPRVAWGCRHSEGVLFGKYFRRWSLLAFHWCRWSLLSKILNYALAGWENNMPDLCCSIYLHKQPSI